MAIPMVSTAAECAFYVGTYTKAGGSAGIYRLCLNIATGALATDGLAAASINPTFLTIAPDRVHLYAVNETGAGEVSAFVMGAEGQLTLLNREPSRGDGPCHLAVDATGESVLVANYGSGSVAALPIRDDGSLGPATSFVQHTGSGPNSGRQKEPHAHGIYSQGTLAYACDLGTDEVRMYRLNPATGALTPAVPPCARVPPGSGPRHLAFNRDYAHVINELLNTITTFRRDATTGALTPLHSIATLPAGYTNESTTAEIVVHPNGRFLYASNRGHDSIAAFSIGGDGALALVAHTGTQGKTPRSFALDPSGRWLVAANQDSGNLVVFEIDVTTGRLTPTGHTAAIADPVCVLFVPSDQIS